MKQPVILLTLCFVFSFSHAANAQTNFEETYKKAYAFTTTNTDSAFFWAQKCVKIAQTNRQKYKAYYFLAYIANRHCLFGLAQIGYTNAVQIATDSMAKYDVINGLAEAYLKSGKLSEAISYNQQSVEYFQKRQNWLSLSYAYQLKASILRSQQNYAAIDLMKEVIRLRNQYAPKQLGSAYHRLAETFQKFNMLDSAIAYQQKTIEIYPIKTPDNRAFLNIEMAKYYILNNQLTLAKPHLQIAQGLQKRPLTEAIACHTLALYYSTVGQQSTALAEFTRCDSLLETLLKQAPDIITRQTIAQQAKLLYEDALKLENLPSIVRVRYEGKLQTAYVRLASYHNQLQLLDQAQQQRLNNSYTFQKPAPTTQQWPWYWWAGAGVLLGAILLYAGRQIRRNMVTLKTKKKADIKVADLSQTEQQALQNQRMIEFVAEKVAQKNQALQVKDASSSRKPKEVTTENREILRMFYQQFTYQQIGDELNINPLTVKSKAQRLARYIGYSSPTQLLQAFDPDWPPAKDNSAKK